MPEIVSAFCRLRREDRITEEQYRQIKSLLLLDHQFLRDLVRAERERRWQSEQAEFVAAYSRLVEQEGLPLEQWRMF